MPRYIDAELLEKSLLKPSMFDINKDDMLAIIADIPTADVVPKSEVEELQTENEELQAKVAKLRKENIELLVSKETDIHFSMEKLVKVRTEHPIFKAIEEKVAREIFAEIEKHSRKMQSSDFSGDFWDIAVLMSDIAELKKKYTEKTP